MAAAKRRAFLEHAENVDQRSEAARSVFKKAGTGVLAKSMVVRSLSSTGETTEENEAGLE